MNEHDQTIARMAVAKMMTDNYDADPPDLAEWARALRGCAELYRHAADHLDADPPRFREAANALVPAIKTATDLHREIILAYALSGQAADEMLERLRNGLKNGSGA